MILSLFGMCLAAIPATPLAHRLLLGAVNIGIITQAQQQEPVEPMEFLLIGMGHSKNVIAVILLTFSTHR